VASMVPTWPSPALKTPPTPASSTKASKVGGDVFDLSDGRNFEGTAYRGAAVGRKGGWMWAAKHVVSPAWVVGVRESGCGRRSDIFRRLSKAPVLTKK